MNAEGARQGAPDHTDQLPRSVAHTSAVRAWRRFAKEHAAIRRQLYPGSVPLRDLDRCPLHGVELGSISRMCKQCHDEAWDFTAEAFKARLAA